uniref:Uncharacterized protein n=1 Tax=Ascaris lumbricoides TaxID=6252 RepID=A0A0M3I4L8_ASCLU
MHICRRFIRIDDMEQIYRCGHHGAWLESTRLKRQSPNYGSSACYNCVSEGYGSGLFNYFYAQFGGGINKNYHGTNIGSISVQNVNA